MNSLPIISQGEIYMIVLLGLFFVLILYMALIRPQLKRLKDHRHLIKTLKVGDHVLTAGGVIGTIKALDAKDDRIQKDRKYMKVEVSPGVDVLIRRSMIYGKV